MNIDTLLKNLKEESHWSEWREALTARCSASDLLSSLALAQMSNDWVAQAHRTPDSWSWVALIASKHLLRVHVTFADRPSIRLWARKGDTTTEVAYLRAKRNDPDPLVRRLAVMKCDTDALVPGVVLPMVRRIFDEWDENSSVWFLGSRDL